MCSDIEVVIRSFCHCRSIADCECTQGYELLPFQGVWSLGAYRPFSPFLNHLQCSILITKVTTFSFHVAISMLLPPNIIAFTIA